MRDLKLVGFFRELRHGRPNGGSLVDSVNATPSSDEHLMVSYLKGATVFVACGGLTVDVLSPEEKLITPPHIMTDGEWAWPLDLSYYLSTYHVTLPAGFVEHMISNNWTPKLLSDQELEGLRL